MMWSGAMFTQCRRRLGRGRGGGEVGVERFGSGGVAEDRLAGVDEVQVPALDRGLGLELAAATADRRHDRRPVIDHRESAVRSLELGNEVVPDRVELVCVGITHVLEPTAGR